MKQAAQALGIVMLVIGAGLLLVALNFAVADREAVANGVRAEGQVVAIDSYRGSKGKIWHRPIVSFVDQAGETRQFAANTGSNPPSYARGDIVTVIYDPRSPEQAMIDSFADRHLGRLIFIVMGLFCVIMGGGIIIRTNR